MGKLVKDNLAEYLANEQVRIDTVMKEARLLITNAMEQDGQYTHNVISLTLRNVANNLGYRYANGLVREFDLTETYDIDEIESED